jgi:hypothetical protein
MGRLVKSIGTKGHFEQTGLVGEAADYEAYPEWADLVNTIRAELTPRVENIVREINEGRRWAWMLENSGAYVIDYQP